ncbi:LysR family transcriptional regulator [Insulibacter thermoxylanivorax]|uniref:LysR family transcriptional regulator n=1 Tax=Insulibacter thermoxylanivorax TaxID=2749268 RepID=A0A916QE11_9BACL|nr:LysR family transcriptional regulator [Insulibacter thermoxylanivorax]GFR39026.1 LysR family transcriptional regulator [Insulibacter thermoxylanivorax]
MDDWVHMFIAVVEHSSINRASQVLNISQPALSRRIMKLEEMLGVQLFIRSGKRLELTAAGRMTYKYALELRQKQKKFYQELKKYATSTKRSITLGASLTTLQASLPDLISLFMEIDANLDIKTITGKTHEIVTAVKEQQADLGLVASLVDEPGMVCIPLFADHLKLVIPREHPLAQEAPLSINALHRLPMILFSKGTWYRILVDELFTNYQVVPEIKMEIDSFEAIIRLTATCGAGTLLPSSYLRSQLLQDNGLLALNIKQLQRTVRTTSLIYHMNSETALWMDGKLDAIKQYFAGKAY